MKERLRSVKAIVKNSKSNLTKIPGGGKKECRKWKGEYFLKKMAEKFPKLMKDMHP